MALFAGTEQFVLTADEDTDNAIRKATRTGRPFGTESIYEFVGVPTETSVKGQ